MTRMRPWTDEEVRSVMDLRAAKMRWEDIATVVHRTADAVKGKHKYENMTAEQRSSMNGRTQRYRDDVRKLKLREIRAERPEPQVIAAPLVPVDDEDVIGGAGEWTRSEYMVMDSAFCAALRSAVDGGLESAVVLRRTCALASV